MPEPRHPHFTAWPLVEGFCDRQSYDRGATVAVRASARAPSFTVEVTRVGRERTLVWRREGLSAADHPPPDEAWGVGCDWPVALTIEADPAWPSGFYEVALRTADDSDRGTSHAFFVLRPTAPADPTRPLLVLSTNTWQAYNQWGGRCLYSGAERVSFARPLERGYLRRPAAPDEVEFDGRVAGIDDPADPEHRRLLEYQATNRYPLWTASSGWHNWERRFVRWAEGEGIDVDIAVSADLDDPATAASLLDGRRLLLSVGHDEYWSWGMRDNVDRWVSDGGNWAILSGNTCFWQVRYEDDGRTMVCYKSDARERDPVAGTAQSHLLTSIWSDPVIGRPETSTIGLTFTRGGYHRIGHAVPEGAGAYTVHRPRHWAFAGTGLCYGDQIGRGSFVVGYEVDGCAFELRDGLPVPTGEDGAPVDLEILATCPARLISITDAHCEAPEPLWASVEPPGDLEGTAMLLFGDRWAERIGELAHGNAVMGVFTRGKGTVFNAGSADWAYGLDRDPLVQAITGNVVRHLLG